MPPSQKSAVAATHELKQRVLTCLDRLSDRDTFSRAAAELELTARSLYPDTGLSPFLSCLLSVDSAHHKPAARAHSLRLISSLAAAHRSSLSPHIPRILSCSVLRRLRDSDSAVRSACVEAVSSLARHVDASPFRCLLDPLQAAMSSEQDLNVQIGAAMCLSAAVEASESIKAGELRRALPKMVKLAKSEGFRAKSAIWRLIGSVVAADGGTVVNGRGLMASVVGCAVDSLGSACWAVRKAAAEALEKVATAVEDRELVAEVKKLCIDSLDKRRFDKVRIAREAMNRALEAWRQVPWEDSLLSGSNSSSSKDRSNGASFPPISKEHNHGGLETPQPKKKLTKSRSSVSDCSTITISGSPLTSKSYTDTSSETLQSKKKTLFKSRSSLSSVSTLSDQSTLTISKKRSPLLTGNKKSSSGLVRNQGARKPSENWKIEIVVPRDSSSTEHSDDCVGESNLGFHGSGENESNESDDLVTRSNFSRRVSEERVNESSNNSTFGSLVVPFLEEEDSEPEVVDAKGGVLEEEYDNGGESEDLTLIHKQLVQIEKQQSNLMDLLQSFMGSSQSGINSLETRVSGLEKALDGISYDLALQSGRIPNNESSSGNTCCMIPGAEFWSPKFWKKNEDRSAVAKPMLNRDAVDETAEKTDSGRSHQLNVVNPQSDLSRDSGRNVEVNSTRMKAMGIPPNSSQVRDCSSSFSPTCLTPAVH